jgi:hypothetical protein
MSQSTKRSHLYKQMSQTQPSKWYLADATDLTLLKPKPATEHDPKSDIHLFCLQPFPK